MAVKEVLQKEVFNVKDIMVLCQCGQSVAYRIIREIKSISDRLNLSGRVHKLDYEDYLNRTKKEHCSNPEKVENSVPDRKITI